VGASLLAPVLVGLVEEDARVGRSTSLSFATSPTTGVVNAFGRPVTDVLPDLHGLRWEATALNLWRGDRFSVFQWHRSLLTKSLLHKTPNINV